MADFDLSFSVGDVDGQLALDPGLEALDPLDEEDEELLAVHQ